MPLYLFILLLIQNYKRFTYLKSRKKNKICQINLINDVGLTLSWNLKHFFWILIGTIPQHFHSLTNNVGYLEKKCIFMYWYKNIDKMGNKLFSFQVNKATPKNIWAFKYYWLMCFLILKMPSILPPKSLAKLPTCEKKIIIFFILFFIEHWNPK